MGGVTPDRVERPLATYRQYGRSVLRPKRSAMRFD